MNRIVRISLTASALAAAATCSLAQPQHDDREVVELETVVVTASPFPTAKEDLISSASRLSGEQLRRRGGATLGETLEGLPGVSSSYHGPGAGRPIIRGLGGDRVRVLASGTDAFDVSNTSPDHAVGLEPLLADGIEVVRGPATLLYGSGAIGGVVNVIGKEIPLERAAKPLEGELLSSYGSAADEKTAAVSLNGGRGDFAWNANYLYRDANDHDIPGFAESAFLRESEEEGHGHEEEEGHEEETDEAFETLENSFVETESLSAGGSWFGERGLVGLSLSHYRSDYGVPGGHGHEEEGHEEEGHEEEGHEEEGHGEEGHGEEEGVSIDLQRTRLALRAKLNEAGDLLESAELQVGYGNYRHVELEGDETGTRFDNEGYEIRATAVHRPIGALGGAFGYHLKGADFAALGEEAFIPPNETVSHAFFLVERLAADWGAVELGGRLEFVKVDPDDAGARRRRFTVGSASAGFTRHIESLGTLAANVSYAERAPSASELFAFGPHLATRFFEIGERSLDKESSLNTEVSLRRSFGRVTGEVAAYYADFDNFIFLDEIGLEEAEAAYGELDTEGLGVFRNRGVDASHYGFEANLRFHFIDRTDERLHFDLTYDQTRATNDSDDSNLPRIPARRLEARFEYERGPWLAGLEGRYVDGASNLAPRELPTASHFLWGADLRYRIRADARASLDLFLKGRNLGDRDARLHTSFLKDEAPLPGRDIEVGLRTAF